MRAAFDDQAARAVNNACPHDAIGRGGLNRQQVAARLAFHRGIDAPAGAIFYSTVFGVYGVDSGRICVAALNASNIDAVVAAIAKVM